MNNENNNSEYINCNKFINYVEEPIKEITDSNISSPSLPAPNQNLIQNNS